MSSNSSFFLLMAGTSKTTLCMLIRLRAFGFFFFLVWVQEYESQIFSLFFIVLCNCSSSRPLSNTGPKSESFGHEQRAGPVVVLDPVSTHEPQTKDQVTEKDSTARKDGEEEIKPEHKEDGIEKTRDADSSHCWSVPQRADGCTDPSRRGVRSVLVCGQAP